MTDKQELLKMFDESTRVKRNLLSCPFDGKEAEFNEYGTCISLKCKVCEVGYDWQVCDVVDDWTRYEFYATDYYVGYEIEAVEIVRKALAEAWNTRAKTQREKELEEALNMSLMFADKMADDYGKLSDHLDRKNLTTPSPLIVIREMYNQLVETAEQALKESK